MLFYTPTVVNGLILMTKPKNIIIIISENHWVGMRQYIKLKSMEMSNMFEYLAIAVVLGVISYIIWDAEDGDVIKRGDEWD
jgi:hypothetical protein